MANEVQKHVDLSEWVLKHKSLMETYHMDKISLGFDGRSSEVNRILEEQGITDFFSEEKKAKQLPYLVQDRTFLIKRRPEKS